ncbi:hypothetical protein B0H99_102267 [Planomicrobium soli]|uniref:Uncharacterized protein n=1 Tax=Planomicrobium soli TaxID=1176648 RepID=A0A2P8H5V0_9BACL|nr:aspartyl-tRNA synthetase [Planomicrobium soli]PSL41583.1 hypothetical protein B0H99_102267 [Planomicrobium soli]
MWSISESKISYEEPQEALLAESEELVLIPTYKTPDEALFFFIDNQNNLGAVMVYKNIFGWKTDFRTWSSMNSIITKERVGGYQIHGDEIIFGLMKGGDNRVIMVDNVPAITINLELMLPDESENQEWNGLYLWYYETDDLSNLTSLSLVDRSTNEEIDTSPFSN